MSPIFYDVVLKYINLLFKAEEKNIAAAGNFVVSEGLYIYFSWGRKLSAGWLPVT